MFTVHNSKTSHKTTLSYTLVVLKGQPVVPAIIFRSHRLLRWSSTSGRYLHRRMLVAKMFNGLVLWKRQWKVEFFIVKILSFSSSACGCLWVLFKEIILVNLNQLSTNFCALIVGACLIFWILYFQILHNACHAFFFDGWWNGNIKAWSHYLAPFQFILYTIFLF